MDAQFFWLMFLIASGAIVCVGGLLQDFPTDRSAIDDFAGQSGLRIISVTRAYDFLRYRFRGIRFYEVIGEDSEGNRGDIHVGFDSLFGPGQLVVLEQQGLTLPPPGGSAGLTQPASATTRLSWRGCESLLLFAAGASLGGGFFCVGLLSTLSPSNRPVLPEPALGFTHLFRTKRGDVYGTLFEYLAVTFGAPTLWIAAILISVFLGIVLKARISRRWQVFAGAAISMALCYAIWRLSIYAARP
jgi:hypothetical protein